MGGLYFTPEDDSLMLDSLSFPMSLSPIEGGVTLGSSSLDGKSGNTSGPAFGTWSATLPDESKMFFEFVGHVSFSAGHVHFNSRLCMFYVGCVCFF